MHLRYLIGNAVEKMLMFLILCFSWVCGVARRMSRDWVCYRKELVYFIFLRVELCNGMQ